MSVACRHKRDPTLGTECKIAVFVSGPRRAEVRKCALRGLIHTLPSPLPTDLWPPDLPLSLHATLNKDRTCDSVQPHSSAALTALHRLGCSSIPFSSTTRVDSNMHHRSFTP